MSSSIPPKLPIQSVPQAVATQPVASFVSSVSPSKTTYPSEQIDLPSDGFFYPADNVLSSGKIDIKYMTAREEDILTSSNLLKKGIALEKLLEALIVTPGVKLDDILSCDKNAIYVQARILAYGAEYDPTIRCPSCSKESTHKVNLSALKIKPMDYSKLTKGINKFDFQLPYSKKTVTFKLLNSGEERAIEEELKALTKLNKDVSSDVTTRLNHIIIAVDGASDAGTIRQFVNDLQARDSRELRKYIASVTPEIDFSFKFICPHCGHEEEEMTIPIGINFFWPDA